MIHAHAEAEKSIKNAAEKNKDWQLITSVFYLADFIESRGCGVEKLFDTHRAGGSNRQGD